MERFSSPDALADETCGGTLQYQGQQYEQLLQTSNAITTEAAAAPLPLSGDYQEISRRLHGQEPTDVHEKKNLRLSRPNAEEIITPEEINDTGNPSDHHHYYDYYGDVDDSVNAPGDSQIWNGMIHPFLPMRFAGAVWYQGEANADNATSYACRFPAMISDWRDKFQLPDMSFFYVQLAAFSDPRFTLLRSAQDIAIHLPNVGVALAIDLGDPQSPNGPIHPRRKQEIGRRLALSARAIQYNEGTQGDPYFHMGPILDRIQLINNDTQAVLWFDAKTTEGWHLHGTAACEACCENGTSPFHVLGGTGKWYPARIVAMDSNKIAIQAINYGPIFGVRIHWEEYPQCALYNGNGGPDDHEGLPAFPTEWCAHPSGMAPWTGNACRIPSLVTV